MEEEEEEEKEEEEEEEKEKEKEKEEVTFNFALQVEEKEQVWRKSRRGVKEVEVRSGRRASGVWRKWCVEEVKVKFGECRRACQLAMLRLARLCRAVHLCLAALCSWVLQCYREAHDVAVMW